jgi:uncharacterized hydrophobic protein (TIGR00271 family)
MDQDPADANPEVEKDLDNSKAQIQLNFRTLWKSVWTFTNSVLSLRQGVDQQATEDGIRADVNFQGHAAWILVCSALIASIGLGENSIPVIIGAMLISPLMGPILGVGLAAGINDFELLKKSLANFSIAVVISFVISTVYFIINPCFNVTAELASRKEAVLTAIAIAFVGGVAGIIAGSRRHKSNVVPGVAIATALMPPLCTAGYGLASLQWDYFFGALYLFFINSVFIAAPTYLYIKYMRFPVKEFVDPGKARRIKRYIMGFIIIIILPSAYGFIQVFQKSRFDRNVQLFIAEVNADLTGTGTSVISQQVMYNDTAPVIRLALMGKPVSDEQRMAWENQLDKYSLPTSDLFVIQNEDPTKALQAMRAENENEKRGLVENLMIAKDEKIAELEKQLQVKKRKDKDFVKIAQQAKFQFDMIDKMGFSEQVVVATDGSLDTIPTVMYSLKRPMEPAETVQMKRNLSLWLTAALMEPRVTLVSFPIEAP